MPARQQASQTIHARHVMPVTNWKFGTKLCHPVAGPALPVANLGRKPMPLAIPGMDPLMDLLSTALCTEMSQSTLVSEGVEGTCTSYTLQPAELDRRRCRALWRDGANIRLSDVA